MNTREGVNLEGGADGVGVEQPAAKGAVAERLPKRKKKEKGPAGERPEAKDEDADAKEGLKQEFAWRLRNEEVFSADYSDSGWEVLPKDIKAGRKHGRELVGVAYRSQLRVKLDDEVKQARTELGLVEAERVFKLLEELPSEFRKLNCEVSRLYGKRRDLIALIGAAGRDEAIRQHLRSRGDERVKGALESDPAGAYVFYVESKSGHFSEFYRTWVDSNARKKWADKLVELGVPFVLDKFLESKQGVIEGLDEKTIVRAATLNKLFDPRSVRKNIDAYDRFLDAFITAVQSRKETVTRPAGEAGDCMVDEEAMDDQLELGEKPLYQKVAQPLRLGGYIIRKLDEKDRYGDQKCLYHVEEELGADNRAFAEAAKERGKYLDALLKQRWAEVELAMFRNEHPDMEKLRARDLETMSRRSNIRELTKDIKGAKQDLLSLRARLEEKGLEKEFDALNLVIEPQQPTGQGAEGSAVEAKVAIKVVYGAGESAIVLEGDSSNFLRVEEANLKRALQQILEQAAEGAKKGPGFIARVSSLASSLWNGLRHPGRGVRDKKIEAELPKPNPERVAAESQLTIIAKRRRAVGTADDQIWQNMRLIRARLERGNFLAVAEVSGPVIECLDALLKNAQQAAERTLTEKEERNLEEYRRLWAENEAGRRELSSRASAFKSDTFSELRQAGWRG